MAAQSADIPSRWQLYRALADPARLRLLALAGEEELSVGELAEILGESQPNISRQAGPLRQLGVLVDRRQGTRTFIRLADEYRSDPVVGDALREGKNLCEKAECLSRIAAVVGLRDQRTREYFGLQGPSEPDARPAPEIPAYAHALARVRGDRDCVLDAGTGEGLLLDVLAPSYRRVVAVDRSPRQLERARARVRLRGYANVTLVCGELHDEVVRAAVHPGADTVFASRILHHAAVPRVAMATLAGLLRPRGTLLLMDYAVHADEALREQRADVWLGFAAAELARMAEAVGLDEVEVSPVPPGLVLGSFDGHLSWLLLVARRPADGVLRVSESDKE